MYTLKVTDHLLTKIDNSCKLSVKDFQEKEKFWMRKFGYHSNVRIKAEKENQKQNRKDRNMVYIEFDSSTHANLKKLADANKRTLKAQIEFLILNSLQKGENTSKEE